MKNDTNKELNIKKLLPMFSNIIARLPVLSPDELNNHLIDIQKTLPNDSTNPQRKNEISAVKKTLS